MSDRPTPIVSLSLVVALFLSGCDNSPPPAPPVPESSPAASAFDASHIPDAPDEAVSTVVKGIQDRHPDALWHFLPASYQSDINDLVHSFAGRMDPEMWSKTVAVLKKTVRVFKDQKEFVKAMAGQAAQPAGSPPPPDVLAVIGVVDTLLESELGDLDRLKNADAGEFLAVTGSRIMQQLQTLSKLVPGDPLALGFEDLADLKVSLISSEGDRAVLLIEAPGADPRETNFVRVEGKWIPQNLADSWIESIGEAKARLSLLSRENMAEMKPQWLTLLKTFDQSLDDAADAKDQQQFSAALTGMAFSIQPLVGLIQSSAPAEPVVDGTRPDVPEDAADLVTVVVRGKLSIEAQDTLGERLKSATGASENVFAEMTGDDQVMSYKIGPVKDLDAFVEKLDFLKVSGVDAPSRTITASPK